MKKAIFQAGCYLLLSMPVFAQTANVDSLKSVLQHASHDSVRFKALQGLVSQYQIVDPNQGKFFCSQLIEVGRRLGDEYRLQAELNLVNLLLRLGQIDSVEIAATRIADECRAKGNSVREGSALIALGAVREKQGRISEAIECYQSSIQKVRSGRDSLIVLNNLGLALVRSNQLEAALPAYLGALKIAEKNTDPRERRLAAVIGGNLSRVYEELGRYPEAAGLLEKSIAIKTEIGDKAGLIFGLKQLGGLLYFKNMDKQRGLEMTQQSLAIAEEIGDTTMIVHCLASLSTMFLEAKRPEMASVQLLRGLSLAGDAPELQEPKSTFLLNLAIIENDKLNFGKAYAYALQALATRPQEVLEGFPEIYFELYTAQKGLGNYQKALEYHERYYQISDSLNNAERVRAVTEIDAKYQSAEKDKSIAILEKDKLAAEAEISRRRNQVLYLSLAAVALALGAGLFFYRNRYRQTLELEKMRSRIAGDLHDEVGSSLSRLNFLVNSFDLQNAPETTAANIEKSKDIMQKAASDIRDVVWAIDARRDKTGDLLDRMEDFAFDMLAARQIKSSISAEGLDREAALNPFVRQNIYLIFKEAVNNIAKHSTATEANIGLEKRDKTLEMSITDNGQTASPQKVKGLGLENMQLRAQRIGGTLNAEQTQNGFAVRLSVQI